MDNVSNHPTISVDKIVRPTRVEVNLKSLKENYLSVKKHIGPVKIMPILKANAYGHGLVKIAQFYQEMEVDYLGVAVVEEGILLRKFGIKTPILVLGGVWENQIPLFLKNDLTITASSIDKLKQIEESAGQLKKKAKVHLKIDTGMERLGVHYYNAERFLEEAYKCSNILVEGIFSHFSNSDSIDLSHTRLQYREVHGSAEIFRKKFYPSPYQAYL